MNRMLSSLALSSVLVASALFAPAVYGQGCGCSSCSGGSSTIGSPSNLGGPVMYATSEMMSNYQQQLPMVDHGASMAMPGEIPIVQGSDVGAAPFESQVSGISGLTDQVGPGTLSFFGGVNKSLLTEDGDIFEIATDEIDNGFLTGIAVGRRFTPRSRFEFEAGFRQDKTKGAVPATSALLPVAFFRADIHVFSAMTNFYLDLANSSRLTPYVGAGVGYAHVDGSVRQGINFDFDNNDTIAFQGIAGLSLKVRPRMNVYAEYRYFATGDLELSTPALFNPDLEGPYKATNIVGGIRFEF